MKDIKTILLGIFAVAILYLTFAFVLWDINAGCWDERQRFACSLLILITLGIIIGIHVVFKED